MYLKSLTMKGFKSFADATTLDLEPGVTVVVGPNGSGKSNVVDAVAWVLGAQGPRVVRSTKMDDVIFAGTEGPNRRSPLGRAEVSLVIDNSSRRLPIDFSEVTISRTLFRTGESEYAINHVPCRLLDVQELLSDSGVGRQQHVIIGQGQLSSILESRPEERRMVIEEAAGILKYRRRRERAVRRLDSSESALMRIQDLLREVRRQLRPLERQAASALRHEELAVELHDLRLYLSGREIASLAVALTEGAALLVDLATTEEGYQSAQSESERAIAAAEAELDHASATELTPVLGRLDQLGERTRGLLALIGERRRAGAELTAALDDVAGLVALEESLLRLEEEIDLTEREATQLAPEWESLAITESLLLEAEVAHAELYEDALSAQVLAEAQEVRTASAQALEELAKTRERHARLSERRESLARRREELTAEISGLTEQVGAERFEQVAATMTREAIHGELTAQNGHLIASEEELARLHEALHSLDGRVAALTLALDDARARAGVERLGEIQGVLGTLADLVRVEDRYGRALEAAIEGAAEAVVIDGASHARVALDHLRSLAASGALLVTPSEAGPTSILTAPADTLALRAVVASDDPGVDRLLDRLLAGVFVASGTLLEVAEIALTHPTATIVTEAGDRFSAIGWRIGAGRDGATRAALEDATVRRGEIAEQVHIATSARDMARTTHGDLTSRLRDAERNLDRLGDLVRTLEGRHSASITALEELAAQERLVLNEIASIDAEIGERSDHVATVQHQLELFESEESRARERAEEAAQARRELESRARAVGALRRDLEVRAAGLEERRRLLLARHVELEFEIAERRASRERADERRGEFVIEELAYEALGRELDRLSAELARVRRRVEERRAASAERSSRLRTRLGDLRVARDEATAGRERIREQRQAVEIEQAERRIREQNALQLLATELGASPEEAVAALRPEIDEGVDPTALRDRLERELTSLGPVNPLAREELLELSARNEFLEAQLEDVRSARRELNQVIRVIDAEIVDVFSRAFADVAHHYEALITSLFPGGSGQLILTAPDDPLSTGVEIEARPAGRNVRRLSLLSGGERSLVAIAFLFAVFRSRPSPFYLMDEVEAALDEPNLLRFLNLVDEFRNEAQLIIVSHQKKTMERGDAIYGVTLQPGGASRVVSQRVRNVVNPTLLALTPTDPSPTTSRSSVEVDPVDKPPVDEPPVDCDTDAVEH